MTKIVERMPNGDDMPDWAQEAMAEGALFAECLWRIESLELQLQNFKVTDKALRAIIRKLRAARDDTDD